MALEDLPRYEGAGMRMGRRTTDYSPLLGAAIQGIFQLQVYPRVPVGGSGTPDCSGRREYLRPVVLDPAGIGRRVQGLVQLVEMALAVLGKLAVRVRVVQDQAEPMAWPLPR